MSFYVNEGSESRLATAVLTSMLAASAKSSGCGVSGCTCAADYKAFKKDPMSAGFIKAHRVKSGKVEAMSPPGFGGTVKHMQDKHPEISNPHALAWSLYEKGDKSHKAAPKGTGAKHVSKEVSEKRSKALKKKVHAGGPGSGPQGGKHSSYGFVRGDRVSFRGKGPMGTVKGPVGGGFHKVKFDNDSSKSSADYEILHERDMRRASQDVKANMPTSTTKDEDDDLSESTQQGKGKMKAGGPGSGRKPGNGLDKTHQWTVSKATGEHLLKSKGNLSGYHAGTYARVSENWPNPPKDKAYSAQTFGSKGATTLHPSLEEAKDAAEKRYADNKK